MVGQGLGQPVCAGSGPGASLAGVTATDLLNPRWRPLVGPGTWTDLAVNLLSGTVAIDHGDHLELRTPANPTFHWGNCLQVLAPDAADDAGRWLRRHAELFPDAAHVAVGLPREPDTAAWEAHGLTVEHEQALGSRTAPNGLGLAEGYAVRPLETEAEWDGYCALFLRENEHTREHDPAGHVAFTHARALQRRGLAEAGSAQFFGIFHDGAVVGHCGMVLCGDVGRYQSVLVDAAHRRRGLAAYLVGFAGVWGLTRGVRELAILAEAGSVAENLYRGLGFTDLQRLVGAFRAPARADQANLPRGYESLGFSSPNDL